MSIYTFDGKPVMRKKINNATEEVLNITSYKPGTYIMRITDGDDKKTYKLIKQ